MLDGRRSALARRRAEALIADLAALAPELTEDALEDELCARLGSCLSSMGELAPEDAVSPELFEPALLAAATEDPSADPRVAAAVHRVLPLRNGLPDRPAGGRQVTGPALWARDAYGSRFAVTAPFSSPAGSDRWYLWDIDACGLQALTVHSGFCPTAGEAFAAWRDGVGEVAAADARLTPIDDLPLAEGLLSREDGITRLGGENEQQLAEFHRSRRLAETVIETIGPIPAQRRPELDAKRAAKQFTTWMRANRTPPKGLVELAGELASSWSLDAPGELFGTCSPHRVAMVVPAVRDYYDSEYADRLVALLPDWIAWLTERNGTPADLAERCLPYARGAVYPGTTADEGPPLMARVIE